MTEQFNLLVDDIYDEFKPQARCERCQKIYGKERPEFVTLLRCPHCDFPFGETVEGIKALAFALQDPKHHVLVDVYAQPVCYIWLRVVRDGVDLTVESCAALSQGTQPEWFDSELSNSGWPDIISPDHKWSAMETSDFTGTWNDWALQEGLCPGQAFLVEFKHPRWYKSGYEYEEWDVEYFWEIVDREPRSPKQAARAWEQWQKQCTRQRQMCRRAKARLEHTRTHDVGAMFIRYEAFSTTRDGWPDGHSVILWTTHGGMVASGRSPSQDRDPEPSIEKAWDDLLKNVRERLPHLDPEVVRKLSRR